MIKAILISGAVLSGLVVANAQNAGKTINKQAAQPVNVKSKKLNHLQDGGHDHGKIIKCGTDHAMELYFQQHPEAKAAYEAAQKAQGAWENPAETGRVANPNSVFSPPPSPLDTIPIVFHILHTNGPENISNQVIYDVVAQLNIDYKKLDPDTTTIDPFFQARATAPNLVFQLATIDPNGNCTNGIIRHYDPNTIWDQTSPGYAYTGTGTGKWDPRKYMNIYIVKSITDGGSGGGGGIIVGYTYRPGTLGSGSAADAIVYNVSFLDIPTKEVRSLEHEIGHWLNLAHTFGSTNNPGVSCGDDFLGTISGVPIDDTPKTLGFFSTCPAQTPNSCDVSNYANVENIMDYSSCPKMFTLGQAKRMRYTLTQATSGRNNLVSSANKIATGVRNPLVCSPVANFGADKRNVCVGTAVTFADSTENALVTTYQWDFPGGNPATSNLANPSVTYATPGTYAVTYTATNTAGSDVITKTSYITVYSSTADIQSGYSESFESITVPNTEWTVENPTGPGWVQTNSVGFTGNSSMKIDNYTNSASQVETFYTPSYNISGINSANPTITFTFKLAYQRKSTGASEKLQVFSSTNCGQTWQQRYSKSGSGLATVTGANTSAFTPTSAADWRTETVSLSAVLSQTNVKFKFVFTSDANGDNNNVYVDDINIMNPSIGIAENMQDALSYNVYPNPSKGNVFVSFNTDKAQIVKLELIDMLGRTIDTPVNKNLAAGDYEFTFGGGKQLSSGVYFSKLTIGGYTYTKKIIVE